MEQVRTDQKRHVRTDATMIAYRCDACGLAALVLVAQPDAERVIVACECEARALPAPTEAGQLELPIRVDVGDGT